MTAPGDVQRPDGTLATVPTAGIADEDSGVLVRPMAASDAPRWLESLHDADQRRFGTPAFLRIPDQAEDLQSAIADGVRAHGGGQPAAFTIADVHDPARFLGTISWRTAVSAGMRIADIGYGVHPDSRGRGRATSAVALLARWLLRAAPGPRLRRVQLDHSVENAASCRVATKAGLVREGVRRGYLPLVDTPGAPPRWHDVCLHGAVAADVAAAGRERASVLPVDGDRVALMRRWREGREYLVPLGGGLEEGETVEQAAARELQEEGGLVATPRPDQLWVSLRAGAAHGSAWHHLFVVRGWRGRLSEGDGPEYDRTARHGTYEPVWRDLAESALAPLVPQLLVPLLLKAPGSVSRA